MEFFYPDFIFFINFHELSFLIKYKIHKIIKQINNNFTRKINKTSQFYKYYDKPFV